MADPRDVTGVWYGRYLGDLDPQDNSFIAVLEESGGEVGGTITEPDDSGQFDIRRATVSGRRNGAGLRFIKQYDGRGGWDHKVFYAGSIDDQGTVVNGTWRVDWLRGRFTMQREKFVEEEIEQEDEVELPVR